MEVPQIINLLQSIVNSDPAIAAGGLGSLLTTYDIVRTIGSDPKRFPQAILSLLLTTLASVGTLELVDISSPDLIRAAVPLGYILPSVVRGITTALTGKGDSLNLLPLAAVGSGAAVTGTINIIADSIGLPLLDLYHTATVGSFRSTMNFFGDALSSFGKVLPTLAERVKTITK